LSKSSIAQSFAQSAQQLELGKALALPRNNVQLKGLVGSALSFVVANAFEEAEKPFLLIFNDKEEAAYYLNDLEQLLGDKNVLFYPGSYRRPYQLEETDNANVLLRAEVLNRINSRKKPAIIITYPDALFEKVVTRKELEKNTLKIKVGDELSIDFVNEVMFEYKFKRVDFVTEPGEFSVRGGILDVFSFSNDEPYRIEFFGDEVESIRTFDVETQLSTDQVKKITVIPNVEHKRLQEVRESFLKYISDKTVIFSQDPELMYDRIDKLFSKAEEAFKNLSEEIKHNEPEELFCNSALLKEQMQEYSLVVTNSWQTLKQVSG
jgi:transcription-repair coupling factor (superfamily II helicase)